MILQSTISIIIGLPSGLDFLDKTEDLTSPPHMIQDEMRLHVLKASYIASLTRIRVVQSIYGDEFASVNRAIDLLDQFAQDDDQRMGSRLDTRRVWPAHPSEPMSETEETYLTNFDVMQSFGVMLLTRPFLYICAWDSRASWETDGRLRSLAEACVASSIRTLFALTTGSRKLLIIHNSVLLWVDLRTKADSSLTFLDMFALPLQ